jgi:hypothetical protein
VSDRARVLDAKAAQMAKDCFSRSAVRGHSLRHGTNILFGEGGSGLRALRVGGTRGTGRHGGDDLGCAAG